VDSQQFNASVHLTVSHKLPSKHTKAKQYMFIILNESISGAHFNDLTSGRNNLISARFETV
jgi:hypothetical protein